MRNHAMNYWLVKSEPETWSWDDQLAAKGKRTHWDGVRNHQASNFMKEMKKGDRALFYHSGSERQVVGIVEIVKTFYPDPSDETGKFGMVDVKAVEALRKPVTLKQVKADARLKDILLGRNSRLSVMAIDEDAYKAIVDMAK